MKVKKKSADDKPWEKMYTGKAADKAANKPVDKAKATGKSEDRTKAAGTGKTADKYKSTGTGKAGDKYKSAGTAKPVKDEKSAVKKIVKEPRDFLYLLPKKTTAKSLAKALDFLDKKAVEVWDDECILEITTKEGVITFEDIRESLEKNDLKILNDLRTKQVLSCDYESTNSELVQKVMTTFLKEFGGKIGSDTEDFEPFVPVEKL
jgi:transcriptional regulator of met regulon